MKYIPFLGLLMSFFILFTSCEKVIDIELDNAESQIVIEAILPMGEQPFRVNISQTAPYFENELSQKIEHATIVLRDSAGNQYDVPHTENGVYVAFINAIADQNYTLEVTIDGQLYDATSYLPTPVELETIYAEYRPAQGPLAEGYAVYFQYNDPANMLNYYRAIHYLNGELQNLPTDLMVFNDNLRDGVLSTTSLLPKTFELGDTITVELMHFDEASYTYFSTLNDIIGGGRSGSAAPGNPTSNWSNNALGYFSAYSLDRSSFVVE